MNFPVYVSIVLVCGVFYCICELFVELFCFFFVCDSYFVVYFYCIVLSLWWFLVC